MTIRRRFHVYAGGGNEETYARSGVFSVRESVFPGRRLPTHPAITDFGPDTLTEFVRDQVRANGPGSHIPQSGDPQQNNAWSDFSSPTSHHEPTRTQFRPHTPRGFSRDQLNDMQARHLQAEEAIKPATLSLAPNALRHLHGVSDASPTSHGRSPANVASSSPVRKVKPSPRKRNNSMRSTPSNDEDDPFLQQWLGLPRTPAAIPSSPSRPQARGQRPMFSPRRSNDVNSRQTPRSAAATDGGNDFDTLLAGSHAAASARREQIQQDQIAGGDGTGETPYVVQPFPANCPAGMVHFDYNSILPTNMPTITTRLSRPGSRVGGRVARTPARQRLLPATPIISDTTLPRVAADGDSSDGDNDSEDGGFFSHRETPSPRRPLHLSGPSRGIFDGTGPSPDPNSPPNCPLPSRTEYRAPHLPADVWIAISEYLSVKDIHNLRQVNRELMEIMSPVLFRNLVVPLNMQTPVLAGKDHQKSILTKWGKFVHRFGIALEYDAMALAFAKPKQSMQTEHAWYGTFQWPTSQYPRDPKLAELEDLVSDNNPMLSNILNQLPQVHELALSVDSGHGWLEGPDISDMALFDRRQKKGPKVFGQKFKNEYLWDAYSRDQYFKWAQQNAINATLSSFSGAYGAADAVRTLSNFVVRERQSFMAVASQPDFDPFSHTGGQAGSQANGQALPPPPGPPPAPAAHHNGPMTAANLWVQAARQRYHVPLGTAIPTLNGSPITRSDGGGRLETPKKQKTTPRVPLQWPIIFNGVNVAAETGGLRPAVQSLVASPHEFPLQPGALTEAQAQWLMELRWAQEHFLITFTHAIVLNGSGLGNIQVLNIAKISSGLLPALGQPKFWAALPKLQQLKLLVSSDWRSEHRPQSLFVQKSLLISPLAAVGKFAKFLQDFVCNNEKLSTATFGWAAGGEHAVGILARNSHLLPAPIVSHPQQWITNHDQPVPPEADNMIKFDHIRDLTFENCWFSPFMLETFMERSKDTSLHTLTFDSVSMLARHHSGNGERCLTTLDNDLKCRHSEDDWVNEEVPASATWFETLDSITPGITLLDRKYEAGMIDPHESPRPVNSFRGHVQNIVLKSCGYAKIKGMCSADFNQINLVVQPPLVADAGLRLRAETLRTGTAYVNSNESPLDITARYGVPGGQPSRDKIKAPFVGPIMLRCPSDGGDYSRTWPDEWRGVGTLTSCIHPVEKRLLEQAWGMQFGWGDTLDRWAAVEDGKMEGGTGRFSGMISAGQD